MITSLTAFSVTSCASCGVEFALPDDLIASRRSDGKTFWCPNGHRLSWTKTEADRLRAEKDRLENQLKYARASRDAARDQAEAAERSARAYKGVATRVKNRAAHGVCPAPGCKRSFADVTRHVAGQHPEFLAEQPGGAQ